MLTLICYKKFFSRTQIIEVYSFLVLTDTENHSSENSIYGLLNAMFRNRQIGRVKLVSRSAGDSASFFKFPYQMKLRSFTLEREVKYPELNQLKYDGPTDLKEFDFIFLRLPPPLDPDFASALSRAFPETRIINRPNGIIETGNKQFLLQFPDWIADSFICESWEDLVKAAEQFELVLKPLNDYGGKGIVRMNIFANHVRFSDRNLTVEEFRKYYEQHRPVFLAMKYLKNVHLGDKRIVVVNGRVLTASLRYPAPGGWICNISQGGRAENAELELREYEMIEDIDPVLRDRGILYYGMDTLVDDDGKRVLSELNTTSIGGIYPAELRTAQALSDIFVTEMLNYCRHIQ